MNKANRQQPTLADDEAPRTPSKEAGEAVDSRGNLLQSTSENSPEGSQRKNIQIDEEAGTAPGAAKSDENGQQLLHPSMIPRVVIRHRTKNSKKAQKRLRKN